MSRREFSAKTKALAFRRAVGRCEPGRVPDMPEVGCGKKLYTGDINYDHVDPDGLTGEPTLENCAVLCKTCHLLKTSRRDVPNIAKAIRRERAHIGIKRQPKGRPFPCGRNSPYRKKITGEVVRR